MTVDELRRRLKAIGLTPRLARNLCWVYGISVRELLEQYELNDQDDEDAVVPSSSEKKNARAEPTEREKKTPKPSGGWPQSWDDVTGSVTVDADPDDPKGRLWCVTWNGQTRYATAANGPGARFTYRDQRPTQKSTGTRTKAGTTKTTKGKTKPSRQAYLSQATRDWLAQLRREGECGLWTITQNIVESIVTLPPRELAGYLYMRGLALNEKHPGCFWISHEKLSRKLGIKLRRAKQVTKNLREWNLIELKRRGAGLYGTANYYSIRPLTQDLLDGLLAKVHSSAPTRVHSTAPHRLSSKERASASPRLAEGSARSAPEGVDRRPLRLIQGGTSR